MRHKTDAVGWWNASFYIIQTPGPCAWNNCNKSRERTCTQLISSEPFSLSQLEVSLSQRRSTSAARTKKTNIFSQTFFSLTHSPLWCMHGLKWMEQLHLTITSRNKTPQCEMLSKICATGLKKPLSANKSMRSSSRCWKTKQHTFALSLTGKFIHCWVNESHRRVSQKVYIIWVKKNQSLFGQQFAK